MNIDRLILLFKSRNNIRLERNVVVTHDIPLSTNQVFDNLKRD